MLDTLFRAYSVSQAREWSSHKLKSTFSHDPDGSRSTHSPARSPAADVCTHYAGYGPTHDPAQGQARV